MYNKVQVDSRVPQLEKGLEEVGLKWADVAKERAALAVEVKIVPKLEVDVVELRKTIAKLHTSHQGEIEGLHIAHQAKVEILRSLHSAEIESKDSFCEAEKVQVLSEL